jgi:Ca2+-binding RTX toxin-like protein
MCMFCQSASDFLLRHGTLPPDGMIHPQDTGAPSPYGEVVSSGDLTQGGDQTNQAGGTQGPVSGNPIVNAVLWNGLKFNFGDNPHFIYVALRDFYDETWAAHPEMQDGYRSAYQEWQMAGEVQFIELSDFTTPADMIESLCSPTRMDQLAPVPNAFAFHNYPNSSPEDGVYSVAPFFAPAWSNSSMRPGGLGVWVFVHELGHGLGLKHPFDNLVGTAPTLPASLDHMFWTVMSYNANYTFDASGQIGLGTGNPIYIGANPLMDYGYAATPMAIDIAALQFLYGAKSFHNTDDLYVLPDVDQGGANPTAWRCIWDTGGNDSIVYFGSRNVFIDLTPATLDNTSTGGGVLNYAANVHGGYTIAGDFMNFIPNENGVTGVIIENIRAGSGNDTLSGNDVDNVFYGGLGIDNINGRGGQDTIDYSDTTQGVLVRLQGSSGIINLPAQGTGPEIGTDNFTSIENVWGGSGADTLYGSDEQNVMRGNGGADTIYGSLNVDSLDGGPGTDTLNYALAFGDENINLQLGAAFGYYGLDALYGFENVVSGIGDDTLAGNSSDNVLDGSGGIDTLNLTFATQATTVVLGPHLVGQTLFPNGFASGAEIGSDTLIGIENVIGGSGADTITGDQNANVFTPEAGKRHPRWPRQPRHRRLFEHDARHHGHPRAAFRSWPVFLNWHRLRSGDRR